MDLYFWWVEEVDIFYRLVRVSVGGWRYIMSV